MEEVSRPAAQQAIQSSLQARRLCSPASAVRCEWKNATIPAYQRRTKQADALIAGAYLAGTNTRRVRRALAALFGGAADKCQLHYGEVGLERGELVTSGLHGWTMVVTGVGGTIASAQDAAYRLADRVIIPNVRFRRDIGSKLIAPWGRTRLAASGARRRAMSAR